MFSKAVCFYFISVVVSRKPEMIFRLRLKFPGYLNLGQSGDGDITTYDEDTLKAWRFF